MNKPIYDMMQKIADVAAVKGSFDVQTLPQEQKVRSETLVVSEAEKVIIGKNLFNSEAPPCCCIDSWTDMCRNR